VSTLRIGVALLALLAISAARGAAQEPSAEVGFARAHVQTTLRAFYRNLAQRDWEALTHDILAAKVVAHRPAPEALIMAANPRGRDPSGAATLSTAAENLICASEAVPRVDRAIITFEGNWAEVSVPHCAPLGGADEFRLIHFEERWRIVYINLFQESVNVSADR
jgi:hypothetical protein